MSPSPFRFPALIESADLLMRPPEPRDAEALFEAMLGDAATTRDLSFKRHTQLDETLAFIDDSEAIGVAVRGQAEVVLLVGHDLPQLGKILLVALG